MGVFANHLEKLRIIIWCISTQIKIARITFSELRLSNDLIHISAFQASKVDKTETYNFIFYELIRFLYSICKWIGKLKIHRSQIISQIISYNKVNCNTWGKKSHTLNSSKVIHLFLLIEYKKFVVIFAFDMVQ